MNFKTVFGKVVMEKTAVPYSFLLAFILIISFVSSCSDDSVLDQVDDSNTDELRGGESSKTTVVILNPGFEDGKAEWGEEGDFSISTEEYSGGNSAKTEDSGDRLEQQVSIATNTDYTLSVYVKGGFSIGVNAGGATYTKSGEYGDWTKVDVTFNSQESTSAVIFAAYNNDDGRYDDFSLEGTFNDDGGDDDNLGKLSIAGVSSNSDDGNGPENTLDSDLDTRWSAEGIGQYITYDLGEEKTVGSIKIAWHKGDIRSSRFKIRAGNSTSTLVTIFNGNSSGGTLQMETYDFTDTQVRYVRITGLGNTENDWNSVTETEIYGIDNGGGGDDDDTTPPGSISNLSAVAGNGTVSLSWTNPTDSDFRNVVISYDGKTLTSSGNSTVVSGLTNGTAYKFAVKAYDASGNGSSAKSVNATPEGDGGGGGGGSDSPGEVLGLTSNNWKLNGFTGSPGSSAEYEDDILDATGKTFSTYVDDNYFYTDGEWTFFKCYRGLGGSANSSNPRVELREMKNGDLADWDGSGNNNSMTWTVKVDRLPQDADNNGGVLCFGQIHAYDDDVDDVIRVQFLGEENQSSGNVRVKISGYITEDVLNGSVILDREYKLGTAYTFTITYNNDVVKLFDGSTEIFSQEMDTNTDGNYFKVGNYLQSVQGASYTGSYGLVAIKDLSISNH